MRNDEIADAFAELADRLALTDEKPFRYMAYRKADSTFRELGQSVAVLSREGRLREIDGIGPAIEEKVQQLLETGSFPALDRAREQVDDTLLALTRLPGIGPATAHKVFAAADGEGFDSLVERAGTGQLATGAGITKKVLAALADEHERRRGGGASVDPSLSGVPRDEHGEPLPGPWFRRDQAQTQLAAVITLLLQGDDARVEVGGEYARGCELVSGLELQLVAGDSEDLAGIHERAASALNDQGHDVVATSGDGEFELACVSPNGMPIHVDVRAADERSAHALQLLIGPPAWSTLVDEPRAGEVAPELRERVVAGELPLAAAADLSRELVRVEDLRGDLHGHSDWSDGRATILEMAHAARARGDAWYLVSDHSAPYAMVGGLDEARLLAQADEIARVNEQLQREHEHDGAPAFRVLHGSEVEILGDGSLGLPDSALQRLDWVVASIHVAQKQSADAILQRMQRVVSNPLVDAIGHPTSRRLLRRERTALDVDALIAMAHEHDVVLEVNANPDRLDLDSTHAARALAAGVRLTINCDAHRPDNLDLRIHGVQVARRAGARARDVVNCLPLEELLGSRRRDR
ncbi:MAG: hypothetical protein KDC46_14875 [Thermoleophilia bacterium]|nr:hypothetical protein [Thermoleophilia bacterium]